MEILSFTSYKKQIIKSVQFKFRYLNFELYIRYKCADKKKFKQSNKVQDLLTMPAISAARGKVGQKLL